MGAILGNFNLKYNPFLTLDEKEQELRRQGHTCIRNLESLPPQIGWCEETPCVNTFLPSDRPDGDIDQELEQELRQQGHTCISHLEVFPPQVTWCGQTPCVNTK